MIVLGLEVSTTSLKAMLFDSAKGILKTNTKPYQHLTSAYGEVDPEDVLEQLLTLGRTTIDEASGGYIPGSYLTGRYGIASPSHRVNVDAVALSCTWHSMLLLNKYLKCVSPMYLWCDTMAMDLCHEMRKDEKASYARYHQTGALVNSCYPYYKLLHMKNTGVDLSDKIIAGNGSYFNYRMAGQFVESLNMAAGTGLLDLRNRKYSEERLKEIGITAAQLPVILPPGHLLVLNRETSDALGVSVGTPFVPAMSDGALDQIGAHAMTDHAMTFSVGTSGSMRFHADGPMISPTLDTWCYLAPDGSWLSGIGTTGCCNCVDFVRKLLFQGTDYAKIEPHLKTYMDNAPIFLPFQYGERGPGWNDAHVGSFQDIRGNVTPYHFYYSVLEGVMFNMRQCYERLTSMNGKPERIRLSGGILNSPTWLLMCLNMFGMPMEQVTEKDSSLFGSVLLSMLMLGEVKTYAETEKYSKQGEILLPTESPEIYEERYRRYCEYYDKL